MRRINRTYLLLLVLLVLLRLGSELSLIVL